MHADSPVTRPFSPVTGLHEPPGTFTPQSVLAPLGLRSGTRSSQGRRDSLLGHRSLSLSRSSLRVPDERSYSLTASRTLPRNQPLPTQQHHEPPGTRRPSFAALTPGRPSAAPEDCRSSYSSDLLEQQSRLRRVPGERSYSLTASRTLPRNQPLPTQQHHEPPGTRTQHPELKRLLLCLMS